MRRLRLSPPAALVPALVPALALALDLPVHTADPAAPAAGRDWFTEAAAAVGVDFVHFNGMSGRRYYPEVVGPGLALLDYDGDGDLDLYLVQGAMLGDVAPAEAVFPPPPGPAPAHRLYRNDLAVRADGVRALQFTDLTAQSGLGNEVAFGVGAAVGDYDNDGRMDLYVTRLGPNRLWRNQGDGTFADVTERAGVGDPNLGVSAAFVDYDRDGWLDLFVVNHVAVDLPGHVPCRDALGQPEYCATRMYPKVPSTLYRNRGDGTFEDLSVRAGIRASFGAGLGVVTADLNGDDWPDIYVANDGDPNQLWINGGDGSLRDDASLAGAAVNADGMAEAGMGVDAADFDDDGDEDLFMTNDIRETNTIYLNDGQGWFEDRSVATGLGPQSSADTGFGTAWVDFDNDGNLDVFVANGAVRNVTARAAAGDLYPLGQANRLYVNQGDGRFLDRSDAAGPALGAVEVSRGAAFGDLDNDGDTDIVLSNNSGPTRLLINNIGQDNAWIGLRLVDRSGRDALGARVAVRLASGRTLWRRARADASYASANDPRVLVGLGAGGALGPVLGVDVRWPDGGREGFPPPPLGRYSELRQGQGQVQGTAEVKP